MQALSMVNKGDWGAEWFISQGVYSAGPVSKLINDYGALCRARGTVPKKVCPPLLCPSLLFSVLLSSVLLFSSLSFSPLFPPLFPSCLSLLTPLSCTFPLSDVLCCAVL
jgi:hypothetical protein